MFLISTLFSMLMAVSQPVQSEEFSIYQLYDAHTDTIYKDGEISAFEISYLLGEYNDSIDMFIDSTCYSDGEWEIYSNSNHCNTVVSFISNWPIYPFDYDTTFTYVSYYPALYIMNENGIYEQYVCDTEPITMLFEQTGSEVWVTFSRTICNQPYRIKFFIPEE